MSTIAVATDLGEEYTHWLKSNMLVFDRGAHAVLSTPFLDPFNDGIEISVDHSCGEVVLHDSGKTIENLLDMGVRIDTSERRQAIIQNAISGCGVRLNQNRLEIIVSPSNRAQRMHFLVTAILRLNDLWMTASPRTVTDFFEIVKEYFDEHEILYTANKVIPGRTVEHPIDFIIPLPRGKDRLIKLLPRPSLQTAKVASFTWVDLQDAQPDAERVVLLNDYPPGDADTRESGANQKPVSDNIMSILRGYSNQIVPWSEAVNDADFANRIKRSGT
jgi:hypothetical protein